MWTLHSSTKVSEQADTESYAGVVRALSASLPPGGRWSELHQLYVANCHMQNSKQADHLIVLAQHKAVKTSIQKQFDQKQMSNSKAENRQTEKLQKLDSCLLLSWLPKALSKWHSWVRSWPSGFLFTVLGTDQALQTSLWCLHVCFMA